ncbi:MAG: helix-turn-helix domain-containing protein [Alphaproteobacteria bacterium]
MAKVKHSRFDCSPGCAVEAAVSLIGGKWKCVILWHLHCEAVLRFSDLRRRIPNVTQRTLTNQLRELEEDGLVHREVYPQVPPKVEYKLTEMGYELGPILIALKAWGDAHIDLFGKHGEAGKTKTNGS